MRLNINGVTHRYDRSADRDALAGVDLTLAGDTVTAIMGPSGSGKSTLLSIAAGLFEPSEGAARLEVVPDGPDGAEMGTKAGAPAGPPAREAVSGRGLRAETAWVFQAVHMLAKRTVVDNVMLGCIRHTGSIRQARTRSLAEIEKVGLASRATARIEELSGGEVQRIAVARAFAQDRPLIIADEPTAQLDRANTLLVAAALRSAAVGGRIVLVATHDTFLASQFDRIIHLLDGAVALDQVRAGASP
ncbi:MAG: ATP-binding cassette domain-containing protein [Bifidobacteriaceae bacterium]|jgi:ABC-type lipoprotein export system ATPase subunit|nr:ATP-binding cassette domain-containing protein [Bifidobacteriaceae bacterium]